MLKKIFQSFYSHLFDLDDSEGALVLSFSDSFYSKIWHQWACFYTLLHNHQHLQRKILHEEQMTIQRNMHRVNVLTYCCGLMSEKK